MKEIDLSDVFGGVSRGTLCAAATLTGGALGAAPGAFVGLAGGPAGAAAGAVAGFAFGAATWHQAFNVCRPSE